MNTEALVNNILNMSIREQETFFLSLTEAQKSDVYALLHKVARPKETCELMDNKASFVDWITSHFYVPELNGPIWLAPYQIDALNEATKKDVDGFYVYSLIAWMDIKKSIKSCIAAAVALRMAFKTDWGSIKVVANKKEQAASRSYFYITRALHLNPKMQAMIDDGRIKISNYTINFHFNNAMIKALPLNPEGEAGGNDDLIIWTEAWAAKTKAAQTMYTEMVIPPNKFGRGFKWIESYAGFSGEAPILEPIYKNNVKPEYQIDNTEMYQNGRTFALNNHNPQLPWQTKEYYAQQASELMDSEFLRVHKNMWQSATQSFIEGVQWDLCKGDFPALTKNDNLVLGLDVGLSGDHFAIIGVSKLDGKVVVRTIKTWKPPKNGKLKFSNPTSDKSKDIEYPFGYIQYLCKNFNVVTLRYDPFQAEKLAEDLVKDRIVHCEPFSQQTERQKSDKYLLDLIQEKRIIHDGNATLAEHIKNANVQLKGDNKMRLIKRNESQKIDAAVALSMAAYTTKKYRG